MQLYEYQRSMSFTDLGPNLSDSIFLNLFFSSITTRPTEAKFHVEPPWDGWTKACSNGPGHMTKMAVMPIKNFFSGTERLMTLKLGMRHWELEYHQVCSNDAPGLTLTYFTARLNLVLYAFVWEKVKRMDFFPETIVVYDMKVGRCSQLNDYMKLYEYRRSRSFIVFDPNYITQIQYFKTSFPQ